MQRVLDLDLDFFVDGAAHWRESNADRLDAQEFPPWSLADTIDFLRTRRGLRHPLPGVVIEHHSELFWKWRDAVEAGMLTSPFHVTHVDAHADLGLGDSGYVYLMTDLLYRPVPERTQPKTGAGGLGDGNFLAYAAACRWIGELNYVHNDSGGGDLFPYYFEDFRGGGDELLFRAMPRSEVDKLLEFKEPTPDSTEPAIPFRRMRWSDFRADGPFDAVCLTRSPGFTPKEADVIYDEIRRVYVDEDAWS